MKAISSIVIILLAWLVFPQCTSMNSEGKAIIEQEILLDSIPSGSGIALWKDSLYIISDDAPFVYQLSLKDHSYSQFALQGYSDVSYRIPKPVKPDFEAVSIGAIDGREFLFAFGSGSKSPTRDSLLILDLQDLNRQRIINLTSFYISLQQQTGTPAEQWNIEGSAITKDTLLLFNRGNNLVVEMPWLEFVRFINAGGPFPSLDHYVLKLPEYERHLARVSGACESGNEGDILFCASIEDTPNWYTDGPVIGSYVGIYNRRSRTVRTVELLKNAAGTPLKEKIESIELLGTDAEGSVRVIVAADDDKGTTKLLRISLGGKKGV